MTVVLATLTFVGLPVGRVYADEALIAVASNFSVVAESLVADFEAVHPHEIRISTGSTGKLYAQILRGAPFDVFLAADQHRPERLVEVGRAIAETQRTYARGRLVLLSSTGPVKDGAVRLRSNSFRTLAIANPDLAPYGVAAREVLASLGVLDMIEGRIVMGENIGQTYALVATGNAELGLVAAAQVKGDERAAGSWSVPASMHAAIRQDVVLLTRASTNVAALAFLAYLETPSARANIVASGYEVE
jgi:molybdate transport system substrate-binding protein